MAPIRGPVVPRRRLGAELRRLREEAGLLIEQVAEELECSPSKISRLETGKGMPRIRDIRDMLTLYGIADVKIRDRLTKLAREGQRAGWWEKYSDVLRSGALRPDQLGTYIALESDATTMRIFQLAVVPGLLQTKEYAMTVLGAALIRPHREHDLGKLVELRMRRQEVLRRSVDPLRLHCVLDEAVLRRPVGGNRVMAGQLQALLTAAELPNITIQVLPFSAGVHPGISGSFAVLEFEDAADNDRVYVESHAGSMYLEEHGDLIAYRQLFDDVSNRAPDSAEATVFIASQLASLNRDHKDGSVA